MSENSEGSRIVRCLTALIVLCSYFVDVRAQDVEGKYEDLCPPEQSLVRAYKAAIYDPDASIAWNEYPDTTLLQDSFSSTDDHQIRGIVWKAETPRGYVVVAQGTSMLVAEIYTNFEPLREIGLDVYIYDYRGYGLSSGIKTTLAGMISDYRKRIGELNANPEYSIGFAYGISLGGIIISNAVQGRPEIVDGIVFDSVPHKIPWYAFCPSWLNPIKNLPDDCTDWLLIGAKKDRVIGRRAAKLAKKAESSCGASTMIENHYGHIFMDSMENTEQRLQQARDRMFTLMSKGE